MAQNLIEKIAQKYTVNSTGEVHSGDYITVTPAYIMTHDNTGAVIPKFKSIGAKKLKNKRQVVIALDHNVQDQSEKNLEKYRKIEDFAKNMHADFYPAGRGIGHQIMVEEGYAFPGTMVVASDSHSNMYGGIGCLGTPVVRTDAASIWASSKTWWQIPPAALVELKGNLRKGVTGKDLIISLCGYFNNDEVLNHAVEFTGEGVKYLTIEERLTVANMTTEWGALAGIFPIDQAVINWLRKRADFIKKRGLQGVASDSDGKGHHPRLNDKRIDELLKENLHADNDAYYAKKIIIDLYSVQPAVSGPDTVKTMSSLSHIKAKEIKINKAYLVSCVNSRVDDLSEAAAILRGHHVAEGVEFYIAAASNEVQRESERRGDWQALIEAGAIPLPPGCGPCIGLGVGLLKDGEIGISATNRNFKGRMGSPNAHAYLASPAVVAASALAGKIDYSWEYSPVEISASLLPGKAKNNKKHNVKIINGFPSIIEGEVVFCRQDNINTDGIYPGKYTYVDDFSPEQQASVVMENYDANFGKLARSGDILAAGFNFGTGSSREQAATALKYKGIKLIVAGSFNETYKRNAINNGYLVIEAPKFIKDLKNLPGDKQLTVRTGIKIKIDFKNSVIIAGKTKYSIDPVGEAAQELIVEGGLEEWVKNRM